MIWDQKSAVFFDIFFCMKLKNGVKIGLWNQIVHRETKGFIVNYAELVLAVEILVSALF